MCFSFRFFWRIEKEKNYFMEGSWRETALSVFHELAEGHFVFYTGLLLIIISVVSSVFSVFLFFSFLFFSHGLRKIAFCNGTISCKK